MSGTLCLYVGVPHDEAPLGLGGRKKVAPLKWLPHCVAEIGLPLSLVSALSCVADPFGDELWSGESLEQLAGAANERLEAASSDIQAALMAELHRNTWEPWMESALLARLEKDHGPLVTLSGFVDKARTESGVLVYWAN